MFVVALRAHFNEENTGDADLNAPEPDPNRIIFGIAWSSAKRIDLIDLAKAQVRG